MAFSLLPKMIVPALTDVSADLLKARGIKFLMLDFDNTIVPYTTNIPTDAMKAWFTDMKENGIPVCIVSNSKRERVKNFAAEYGIHVSPIPGNPSPRAFGSAWVSFNWILRNARW